MRHVSWTGVKRRRSRGWRTLAAWGVAALALTGALMATPPALAGATGRAPSSKGDLYVNRAAVSAPGGRYIVVLNVGPVEPMWTIAQAKGKTRGEVMPTAHGMGMGGMLSTFDGHAVNVHVEVHVYARSDGHVLTGLNPTVSLRDNMTGQVLDLRPVVPMYGVAAGPNDWHYGNDAYMHGTYTVTVRIGNERAVFSAVEVAGGASPMAMAG